MNRELHILFLQDQADRRTSLHPDVSNRDKKRQERVEMLIEQGMLLTPEDFFHAAVIFQHSKILEHNWRAYQLAIRATELGYRPARRLAAAAFDRWLIRQGKPQKYGTQYIWDEGSWKLLELDSSTTDDERIAWDVPPLEHLLRSSLDPGKKER